MILNLKSDSTYSRIVQISLIFFTILNLDSDISRHELIVLVRPRNAWVLVQGLTV